MLESSVKFFPAAAGETGRRAEDEEWFRRADLARRLSGYGPANQDPPCRHQGAGLGPVGGQAPVDELDVEPSPGAQFSPAPRSTERAGAAGRFAGRPILLVRSSFWPGERFCLPRAAFLAGLLLLRGAAFVPLGPTSLPSAVLVAGA